MRYLVVGGYAVGHYGYARTTADIDLWIEPGPDNAQRCLDAIKEFGFRDCGLRASDFEDPKIIFRMGIPPLRLELLTSIAGVDSQRLTRGERPSIGTEFRWTS